MATAAVVAAGLLVACSGASEHARPAPAASRTAAVGRPEPVGAPTRKAPSPATARPPAPVRRQARGRFARPGWLGRRPLPVTSEGYGEVQPTPPRLRDRRLATVDSLPPPPDTRFAWSVRRVPRAVLRRSTWSPRCPVERDDLRYVTATFHGFDGLPHTGELLVHASAARDVVEVFRTLYRERFPIEEMRVVAAEELAAPPTGDGNNTTAFVCRPARGSTAWSEHAYGLAVDVNPFHNPYVKDDVVLPELASAYVNRDRLRPGMVADESTAVRAFAQIGWEWGGQWRSLKDWMHFSTGVDP